MLYHKLLSRNCKLLLYIKNYMIYKSIIISSYNEINYYVIMLCIREKMFHIKLYKIIYNYI